MRLRSVGGLVLFLACLGGILLAAVEDRPLGVPTPTPPQIYREAVHGVAWVHAAGSGKGTGWIVDRERRLLVTCAHVVGDNSAVEVFFPVTEKGQVLAPRAYYLEHYPRLQKAGYVVQGKVLRRDRDTDLALVKLESLPPEAVELPLAAEGAYPGDRVYAIGTRYDSDALWGFTAGSVRGPRVLLEGYFSGGKELAKGSRVLEATDPINEGDSGGPLVNSRGAVVGVCAAVEWKAHGFGLFADRAAVVALLERAGRKPAPTKPPTIEASAGREVYRQTLPAIAQISDGRPGTDAKLRATGFLIDRGRRLLLTTAEFVGRNEKVAVTFPAYEAGRVVSDGTYYRDNERRLRDRGRRVVGCVLAKDARRNLALVELAAIPADVSALRLAAAVPAPGESVHTIGNPQGTATLWLYNIGWVRQHGHANLGQTADAPDPAVVLVQMNVSDGEAGAPLLNDKAELVGVVTGKGAAQQQIAYILSAAEVQAFMEEKKAKWQPRTAAEWCDRAAVFVKARLYDRALLDYNAVLDADPTFARACGERSHVQHLRGHDDLALADAERALRLDGTLASAYVQRAAVRTARGEQTQAIADCNEALKLDAESAQAYAVRAEARRQQGDLNRARADADEALWRDRKLSAAYQTRGLILAQKGDQTGAVEEFNHVLLLDPESAAAYCARADSHWARSDVSAALDDYNRALAINATDPLALHGRGRARAARKQFEAALRDYDAALRLNPRLAAAYLDRGTELLRRGETDHAFADFDRALRLQPRQLPDVVLVAERHAQELLREDRNDSAASFALCRRTLGIVLPLVKGQPKTRALVEKGLALAPDSTKMASQAAELCATLDALRDLLRE